VKISVAAVEALSRKERQDETQFTTKIVSLNPCLMYILTGIFKNSHPMYDQTQECGVVFSFTLWITLLLAMKFTHPPTLNA
jgi:hypothetical protein